MNINILNQIKEAASTVLAPTLYGSEELRNEDSFTCIAIIKHVRRADPSIPEYDLRESVNELQIKFCNLHGVSYDTSHVFIDEIVIDDMDIHEEEEWAKRDKELYKDLLMKYRIKWLEFIINYELNN